MFIATATMLTPEVERQLLHLQDTGAFGDNGVDLIRQLLNLRKSTGGPTEVDVARQVDISLRTVRKLDRKNREQLESISSETYASVFLSYGGLDEAFAKKLYAALKMKGVEVYFFPESSTPGERLHRTMSAAIHEYDRILLICSRSSVDRAGVLYELEQVLSREAREGGTELLMPVLLDDFVLADWKPKRPDLARQVRDRVAADFRNNATESEFAKQLDRLLLALASRN